MPHFNFLERLLLDVGIKWEGVYKLASLSNNEIGAGILKLTMGLMNEI